ncbi:RNA-directed DNA polymerase, eukaryota, reverse transcriptase zinc-binding domain protein [Tanacetum coccineum]
MANDSFVQMFEEANGVFLPYLVSDHSPAIMSIPRGCDKKKKSFRFANYVADKEEFIHLIKEEWKHEVRGCQMYKVVQRLKMLKKPLNNLNWHNGNLLERASKLKRKLEEAQSNVDAAKKQIAMNLVNEYTKVAEDELKLLHQKAKIQWLKEWDKNSAYFHNILKARKNKSGIVSICCEDGSRVKGELVSAQFVKHFQNLLGRTSSVSPLRSMGDIVKMKPFEAEALDMIKDVSDKEIKEALFDIDSSKAAKPDGYTSYFFKKAWGIIGSDICLAIREFFISGKILGEINATLIALVPKIDNPNKVSHFRPIACCNVLYKCISKILNNRIKEGLSKVVSLNQSAFIPGRHIQDNILITQELLKGYNRRNGAKRCAMKIDIQKAYDTIS